MERPAEFNLRTEPAGGTIVLDGDWTAMSLGAAGERLAQTMSQARPQRLDLTGIGRLDTAGAFAVVRALQPAGVELDDLDARPESLRLLQLVADAVRVKPAPVRRPGGLQEMSVRIGKGVMNLAGDGWETLIFLGHLLAVLALSVVNPRRIRWAACVSQAERAGLDAIPIVATTAFFIGAVVGLLGANMLRQFGAEVFTVELISIAVMREFNIIITAVLLAGRSASSFAAEIGSMKMNQEIDAMQVLGVDPFEALVFPRFFGLLLTIPLLTFVATLAGLFGGLLVTWSVLDLGPTFFLQRILDNVGQTHFWIGLSKAPVMAAVIAGIGCRQGLEVGGDVGSLGRRVTAAVVHAIFAIILLDAIFALIFMELDL